MEKHIVAGSGGFVTDNGYRLKIGPMLRYAFALTCKERRRTLIQKLIIDGTPPAGYATDDGVNICFTGTEFSKAIADRQDKLSYYVHATSNGIQEEVIDPELLTL